jgi:FMN phosphatase YigB (HAD superfamily)
MSNTEVTTAGGTNRWPLHSRTSHGKPPKAVLIDCGNTILTPDCAVVRRVLDPHGYGRWAESLTETLGLVADLHAIDLPNTTDREPFYEWWRRLSRVPDSLTDALLREVTEQSDLYSLMEPTIRPALRRIRAHGVLIAIVANAEGQTADEMKAFGLTDVVDAVVDSQDVGCRKPGEGIYKEAAARLGVDLPDCWFVGDALFNDVLGPLRSGVGRAFVYDPRGRFTRVPVERVGSMEDMAELVVEDC